MHRYRFKYCIIHELKEKKPTKLKVFINEYLKLYDTS